MQTSAKGEGEVIKNFKKTCKRFYRSNLIA